jgi:hypothetical protein
VPPTRDRCRPLTSTQALCEGRYLVLDVGERRVRMTLLNMLATVVAGVRVRRAEEIIGGSPPQPRAPRGIPAWIASL